MKTRLWGALASIVVLGLLAVTVTACGGGTKATADTAVVSTLAGHAESYGATDGAAAAARFNDPAGITSDIAGNLYVTDFFNQTIRKITPTGVVSTLAGKAGSLTGSTNGSGAAARFAGPSGVTCDAAGNLYVTDVENNSIRKITPTGEVTTVAGKEAPWKGSADGRGAAARFNGPFGIACDAAGNLYVADYANFTIRKITRAGEVTTFAGKAGSRGSVDGSGSVARLNAPAGIACDAAGNVYVADTGNDTIRMITPAGKVTTVAGKAGSPGGTDGSGSVARFNAPAGIACDAAGNVYVADTGNDTIRVITPAGKVTTVAGKAGAKGSADGSGTAARFHDPTGIACDAAGNVYVADSYNSTIRKITLSH